MERKIVVYGHGDKSEKGFADAEAVKQFITEDVVSKQHGRYHYTEGKDADVIVLSRDGLAYGHFEIEKKDNKPNEADIEQYPNVKFVYLVGKRALYGRPVRLMALGIRVHQRGLSISESQFEEIKAAAGEIREYDN